jgi:hypothetical protein
MAEGNAKGYSVFAKYYLQPAFLLCVLVLAIAGSGMSIAIKAFEVHLEKAPLPPKKSLDLLDENGLVPYKIVSKANIENEEIIKELGTENYVQWVLEDPDTADDSPVHNCLLFITYYDLPDRVPHVPEECYVGSGHQILASEGLELEIDGGGTKRRIPVKHLVFSSTRSNYWAGDRKFSAFYLFKVNGVYANSRENARIILNKNIFGRHSYFCKVEWNFLTRLGEKSYPQKEEAVAAGEKLLGVILPVLEGEHWPEWPVVEER